MNKEAIRVLLIEDNPGDAKLIEQMLGEFKNPGFKLQHVKNLQVGLDHLKKQPVDVLILDLGLPGISGIEAVYKASTAAPHLPIIVLSGIEIPQLILDSIKGGVKDYFVKSRIKPEELIKVIERETANKRSGSDSIAGVAQHRSPAGKSAIAILVVEDNPGDLTLTRQLLAEVSTARFEIIPASTLSSALQHMSFGADIVLLDLNLPDSKGLDTLRRFRAHSPALPIIIVTATEDQERRSQALANGAQDYLGKDNLDSNKLGSAILRHIKTADSAG